MPQAMQGDIQEVLIDRRRITRRIGQIARQIAADFDGLDKTVGGKRGGRPASITLVPIITGSIIFVSDLIRRLPLFMEIRLVSASSYPGRATRSRGPKIHMELAGLPDDLRGQHVLLVDDILDTGRTLSAVSNLVAQRRPSSLRSCVLLHKRRPTPATFTADYVCFEVPDVFVVGYGLDYNNYYRNLPDIVVLRPEAIAEA